MSGGRWIVECIGVVFLLLFILFIDMPQKGQQLSPLDAWAINEMVEQGALQEYTQSSETQPGSNLHKSQKKAWFVIVAIVLIGVALGLSATMRSYVPLLVGTGVFFPLVLNDTLVLLAHAFGFVYVLLAYLTIAVLIALAVLRLLRKFGEIDYPRYQLNIEPRRQSQQRPTAAPSERTAPSQQPVNPPTTETTEQLVERLVNQRLREMNIQARLTSLAQNAAEVATIEEPENERPSSNQRKIQLD